MILRQRTGGHSRSHHCHMPCLENITYIVLQEPVYTSHQNEPYGERDHDAAAVAQTSQPYEREQRHQREEQYDPSQRQFEPYKLHGL